MALTMLCNIPAVVRSMQQPNQGLTIASARPAILRLWLARAAADDLLHAFGPLCIQSTLPISNTKANFPRVQIVEVGSYASPNESKLNPSSGLTTLSVGSSTYLRTDCSIALILDGHGVLAGAHYPALIFSSTQGPTD